MGCRSELAPRPDLGPDSRVDDRGPRAGTDLLTLMHADAGDVPGVEQTAYRSGAPRLAASCPDPSAMEILRERGRALALEVAVEDLADDLRLVLDDGHAVLGVAEPPHAALRLALPGAVL